jgi:5-methyltetrahydrofolate--homocysteine methyltransferase
MDIREYMKHHLVYLDGGMGTLLQKRGLKPGELPERWNVLHPEDIIDIHRAYYDAGSNIVMTNTFGANCLKFGDEELASLVRAAVENVRKAARLSSGTQEKFVGLDIGPLGKLLRPYGDFDFEQAVETYAKTIRIGAEAGADLIFIETMNDSYDTKAAVLAAKENCDLPIFASNAYGEDGKLMTGASPSAMVAMLEGLGVCALGANCSLGPAQMKEIVDEYLRTASVPVLLKPNAGLPRSENGSTVYDVYPEEFSDIMTGYVKAGIRLAGGCCGTSPAHIACLDKELVRYKAPEIKQEIHGVVASAQKYCTFGANMPFILIGERINPTGKKALQAELRENKFDLIRQFAVEQTNSGAAVLDINVGVGGIDQTAALRRAVAETAKTVQLPLCIDSTLPEAVEAALRFYPGRALLNSISAEKERIEKILPIAAKYGAMPILLPLSDAGIPTTAKERIELLKYLFSEVEKYGYTPCDCIADALIMTISTDPRAALEALDFIEYCSVMEIGTTCGLSNISFGLPDRAALNQAFLGLACGRGLTSAIANPGANGIVSTIESADALRALDPGLKRFIAKHANVVRSTEKSVETAQTPDMILKNAVVNSLPDAVENAVKNALEAGFKADYLVNEILIPALTEVGSRFEKKEYFLPQLMQSAEAMRLAMNYLEPELKKDRGNTESGPVFVLATVEGDIHDIGKNILNMLLGNHGFNVIDLGKDVPAEKIVETAVREKAVCIGLSALMTTTMPRMREVIELLKEKELNYPVIVGGAAVDASFAEEISAIYASDAMAAVRAAQKIANID